MTQDLDLSPNPSPLAEPSPESLDELFSKDPLELSDQDLERIVSELRAHRALWAQEEAAAISAGGKHKQVKAPGTAIPPGGLTLDLLNLEL